MFRRISCQHRRILGGGVWMALAWFVDAMLGFAFADVCGVDTANGWHVLAWLAPYFAIGIALYGRALDPLGKRLSDLSTRGYPAPLPAEFLRQIRVEGQSAVGDFSTLCRLILRRTAKMTAFSLQYRHGCGAIQHQKVRHLALERGDYARSKCKNHADPKSRLPDQGTFELQLEPASDGRPKVIITQSRRVLLPRRAISLWLYDQMGDSADRPRAQDHGFADWSLSGRYRRRVLKAA